MFRSTYQQGWPILAFALMFAFSPSVTGQQHSFPNFVLVEPPSIQAVMSTENSMEPAKTNSVGFILRAQLVRQSKLDLPLETEALTLAAPVSNAVSLEKVAGPNFAQSCALIMSNTAVQCTLTPTPGPTWGEAGQITMRLKLTGTDGGTFTQLVTATVGQPPSVRVDWSITTRPGRPPASTNGEAFRLTAQLVRDISPLPPADVAIVPILNYMLIAVGANATAFNQSCSLTSDSRTLNCDISPPGLSWSGSPLIFRLGMVAQDSSLASALISQDIAFGPGQVEVQLVCGAGKGRCVAGMPAANALVLHAQVLRPSQVFGGGASDLLEVTEVQIGDVGPNPLGTSKPCQIASGTVTCTLTPAGPTEWPAGFLHYRLLLKLADGSAVVRYVTWQL